MKIWMTSMIVAAGLVAGCNQSVENASQAYNALPPAVQKSIRAQAPNADITGITKTTENGTEAYKVEIQQNGKSSEMLVASDGRVLNSDFASKPAGTIQKALTPTGAVGTQFSALPEAVQKTIQSHAPADQIDSITRHSDNGRVVYEVKFKNMNENPVLRVAEDGTLVQEQQK